MNYEYQDSRIILFPEERIDSGNSADIEKEINDILAEKEITSVIMDLKDLTYISSAGLRILLHVRKAYSDMKLVNVNSDIYEILDITGFTQMLDVEKAYRVVSVEGCEEIGKGANGTIYRIDQDNVVKVYNNPDSLDDIRHEREMAKIALILGIPTAISYDVVRVGNSYGSVFELLNARSFSNILGKDPEKMDWCVNEFVKMLRKIHSTIVPDGKLPDARLTAISWAEFMQDYLPEEEGKKLLRLIKGIPHDDHMIHGDYHTKNLELQGDEVLLIDMDTLAVGHPILELASMFNAFRGFSESDPEHIKDFLGFDYETAGIFWKKTLSEYLGTTYEDKLKEVEDKARIIGYTRLIRRSIKRKGLEDEKKRAEIESWKSKLLELLSRTDTLIFSIDEIDVEAVSENLPVVLDFIEKHLNRVNCTDRAKMQINVAAEEIFVNIASYAYAPEKGRAIIRVEFSPEPVTVTLTFMDNGIPYDPLAKEDPDITLPASERQIGGLGIFMVKKTMDDVTYEYKNGQNILTIKKLVGQPL